jgi:hypothetical protein
VQQVRCLRVEEAGQPAFAVWAALDRGQCVPCLESLADGAALLPGLTLTGDGPKSCLQVPPCRACSSAMLETVEKDVMDRVLDPLR